MCRLQLRKFANVSLAYTDVSLAPHRRAVEEAVASIQSSTSDVPVPNSTHGAAAPTATPVPPARGAAAARALGAIPRIQALARATFTIDSMVAVSSELRTLLRRKSEALKRLGTLASAPSQHSSTEALLPEPTRRKSHWDYLLEETQWMSNDVHSEIVWQTHALKQLAAAAAAAARRREARKAGTATAKRQAVARALNRRPFSWSVGPLPKEAHLALSAPPAAEEWQWQYLPLARLYREANCVTESVFGEQQYPHLPAAIKVDERPRSEVATPRLPGHAAAVSRSVASQALRAASAALHRFVLPPPLAARLRAYQRSGLLWVLGMLGRGCGAVLGDERGLGKRSVAVAVAGCVLLSMGSSTCMPAELVSPAPPHNKPAAVSKLPVVVVAPQSAVMHWRAEFRRWWPSLRVAGCMADAKGGAADVVIVSPSGATEQLDKSTQVALVIADATRGPLVPPQCGMRHLGSASTDVGDAPDPATALDAREGTRLPWEVLSELPTCHRLVLTNRLLPTVDPFIHQLAMFLCPRAFKEWEHADEDTHAAANAAAAASVAAAAEAAAAAGETATAVRPSEDGSAPDLRQDGMAVRDALLPFVLRRQVQDDGIAPQLPQLWVRTVLVAAPRSQARSYAQLSTDAATNAAMEAACTSGQGLAALTRRVALLHAAAQHSAAPAVLQSAGPGAAPAPGWMQQVLGITPATATSGQTTAAAALSCLTANITAPWLPAVSYLSRGEHCVGLPLLQGRNLLPAVDDGWAGGSVGGWGIAALAGTSWGTAPCVAAVCADTASEAAAAAAGSSAPSKGRGRGRAGASNAARDGASWGFTWVARAAVPCSLPDSLVSKLQVLPTAVPLLGSRDCHARGVLPLVASTAERAADFGALLLWAHRQHALMWSAAHKEFVTSPNTGFEIPVVPAALQLSHGGACSTAWQVSSAATPVATTAEPAAASPAMVLPHASQGYAASTVPARPKLPTVSHFLGGSGKFRVLHQLLHEGATLGLRQVWVTSLPWLADLAAAFVAAAGHSGMRLDEGAPVPGVMCAHAVERFNCNAGVQVGISAIAAPVHAGASSSEWAGQAVLDSVAVRGDVGQDSPLPLAAHCIVVLDAFLAPPAASALRELCDRMSVAGVQQVVQLVTGGTIEEAAVRLGAGSGTPAVAAVATALGWLAAGSGDSAADYPCDPPEHNGLHSRVAAGLEEHGLLSWQPHIESKALHGTSAVWAGTCTSHAGMNPSGILSPAHPANHAAQTAPRVGDVVPDSLSSSLLSITRGLPLRAWHEAEPHSLLAGWVLRPPTTSRRVHVEGISAETYTTAWAVASCALQGAAATPPILPIAQLDAWHAQETQLPPAPSAPRAPLAHLWASAKHALDAYPAQPTSWVLRLRRPRDAAAMRQVVAGGSPVARDYTESDTKLWYDVPATVAGGDASALAGGPAKWVAGLVEELSAQQDAGRLHTSSLYGPPHPELRSVSNAVAVIGDTAAAGGLRHLQVQLGKLGAGLYLHPLHLRARQRFYGPAAAVGAGGGTGSAHSVAALTTGTYTSQSFYAHQVPQRGLADANAKYGAGDGALFERPSHSHGWSSSAATSLRLDEERPSSLRDNGTSATPGAPLPLHARFGGSSSGASLADVAHELKRLAAARVMPPAVVSDLASAGGPMLLDGVSEDAAAADARSSKVRRVTAPVSGGPPVHGAGAAAASATTPAVVHVRPAKRARSSAGVGVADPAEAGAAGVGVDSAQDIVDTQPLSKQRRSETLMSAGALNSVRAETRVPRRQMPQLPLRAQANRSTGGLRTSRGGVLPLMSRGGQWASWEDALLLATVREFGTNWDLVRDAMSSHPSTLAAGRMSSRAPRLLYERHRKLVATAAPAGHSILATKRARGITSAVGEAYAAYPGDLTQLAGQDGDVDSAMPQWMCWSGQQIPLQPSDTSRVPVPTVLSRGCALAHAQKEQKQVPSVVTTDASEPLRPQHASHNASIAEAKLPSALAHANAPSGVASMYLQHDVAALGAQHSRRTEPFRESSPYVIQHANMKKQQAAAAAAAAAASNAAPVAAPVPAAPAGVSGTSGGTGQPAAAQRLTLHTGAAGSEPAPPALASSGAAAVPIQPPAVSAPVPAVPAAAAPPTSAPMGGMGGAMEAMFGAGGDQQWLKEIAQRPEVSAEIGNILNNQTASGPAKVQAIAALLRRFQNENSSK